MSVQRSDSILFRDCIVLNSFHFMFRQCLFSGSQLSFPGFLKLKIRETFYIQKQFKPERNKQVEHVSLSLHFLVYLL